MHILVVVFFFQAEDGIRDLVRSRGLGDVYKRQLPQLQVTVVRSPDLGVIGVGEGTTVAFPQHFFDLSLIHI